MVGFNFEDALYDVNVENNAALIRTKVGWIVESFPKYYRISGKLFDEIKKIENNKQWSSDYKAEQKAKLEETAKVQIEVITDKNYKYLDDLKGLVSFSYNDEQRDLHLKNMQIVKLHDISNDDEYIKNIFTAALNKKDVLLAKFILRKVRAEKRATLEAILNEEYRQSDFGTIEIGVQEVIDYMTTFEKTIADLNASQNKAYPELIESFGTKLLKMVN